jgi:hypothetical protein
VQPDDFLRDFFKLKSWKTTIKGASLKTSSRMSLPLRFHDCFSIQSIIINIEAL